MPARHAYARNAGWKYLLIVLHSTESHDRPDSADDLRGVGSWFQNPQAAGSAHVCTDDDGNSARYVGDKLKAYACAQFNSVSLSIEQIGFAAQGKAEWEAAQLRETARWIAHWSIRHGIPITHGAVSGGTVTQRGVITHKALGALGGGHHDPGAAYPFDEVLRLARRFKYERLHPDGVPPYPGTPLDRDSRGTNVLLWQRQMRNRGWELPADGHYGLRDARVCQRFQAKKGLHADGIVGPKTWEATWRAPAG
jgi:N-acetyl-anhydromuramyl-L-alanine amidase AmpD